MKNFFKNFFLPLKVRILIIIILPVIFYPFIILYFIFLYRILILAENQKDKFARVFGSSVFSIIFFHFFVNISMTLGLFPVVGIPLPFVSYGGSSLLSFSLLIFIFLKLNSFKPSLLSR